ncbi:MAG: hypothetical protein QOF28_498, partial [Actinomycetota bacterium]|nr:hypothetical protein [Actinomycetota bacterium]
DGKITAAPSVANGVAYFVSDIGTVHAFHP